MSIAVKVAGLTAQAAAQNRMNSCRTGRFADCKQWREPLHEVAPLGQFARFER